VDNASHWINPYPTENQISFLYTYPLDSVLSSGYCYPTFEQVGPELSRSFNLTLAYHDYTNKYMSHILFFTFNMYVGKHCEILGFLGKNVKHSARRYIEQEGRRSTLVKNSMLLSYYRV